MSVAIVDYGSGNLSSAAKAFERAVRAAELRLEVSVTAEAGAVRAASHVVLPGVGAFADCMAGLGAVDGMLDALHEAVVVGGTPFLGICVGMQLMATLGVEHGEHPGLGWIGGRVVALEPADGTLKIPHMGWNELEPTADHPLLDGIPAGAHVYFVHGYGLRLDDPADEIARVDYGGAVSAAVGRANMVGTQFHPEKSQATGLRLIANFLRWRP